MVLVIESIGKGLTLGILLALSVGPVIFTVIRHSISDGREGGFSFITGVWISDILLIVAANLFTQLLNYLLDFKSIIGIVGSVFLVMIGIYYIFFKKVKFHPNDLAVSTKNNSDYARLALEGFLLNTLNPAVMIFWLTTATALAVSHSTKSRLIIFGTAVVFNMIMDLLKIFLAGKLSSKLTLKNIRKVNKLSGVILFIFGIALLMGVIFFANKLP